MKNKWKTVVIDTLISIGTACTLFCLIGLVFDQIYQGNFSLDHYRFTKMVLGSMGIGLGFGLPTIVYHDQRLSRNMQILIHLGIGIPVYFVIAASLGWIGSLADPVRFAAVFIGQFAVIVVLFLLFRHYNIKEAEQINDQLKKRND